ncbi:MAG: hypothetical protein K0Q79_904 [Flavipsychrobacter sp.]|jgi:class 3 adenylate cyclase|nr:hypothetical protein [Flavipsychrobacter sp.]
MRNAAGRQLLVCLLCFISAVSSARPDTLVRISEMVNKEDSAASVNIFHKFTWDVNVRRTNGSITNYKSVRPDTLFQSNDLDTVRLSASFVVGNGLLNKITSLRYSLEGSVLIQLNGKDLLATGVFQPSGARHKYIQKEYINIIFNDTLTQLDITYLPYKQTKIFQLGLKLFDKKLADEKVEKDIAEMKESYGMGFYYLAFGVVFMFLFVFFREKTENLYFSLFCIFAALSFLWDYFETDILYNLEAFISIFCFEFLSIFFCKILKNREKSKIPLLVIAGLALVCFLPFIRYYYISIFEGHVPIVLGLIYVLLFCYVWISTLYFLIQGIGQKRWEAKTVFVICFIPIAAFVTLAIIYIIVLASQGQKDNYQKTFLALFDYFSQTIVYIYPLAAVFILGKRNGLNQLKLIAQVKSIQELSDENLAKEVEKQHMLENQKESLEKEVKLRTAEVVAQKEEIEKQHDELKVEKKKSDDLLRNILPEEVAAELKEKGTSEAKLFDNVTVLFADFVDFTKAGEAMSPQELVNELHICFKNFDEIISRYNIEKIKTIGDAYLAVSGLPVSDLKHAENVVRASLEISAFMKQRQLELGKRSFKVRIGIHSGSVVAGIVGVKKFAYDIWGDTVNTAARMEQNSEPGKVNISQTTYELVKDRFDCEYRGEIDAKNKGKLKMYFVHKTMV